MRKLGDFLSGCFLGALCGAAIGLLLAPASGEGTRSQLRTRINEIVEEGKRAAAERRAELETELAEAKKARPASKGAK